VRALVALIRRMARGDHTALATLYDETCAAVHGLSVRIVRDESIAEDVTIDVYMLAFREAATYDAARGTPLAWLLALARTRAVAQIRRRRGHPRSCHRPRPRRRPPPTPTSSRSPGSLDGSCRWWWRGWTPSSAG
jgi:DNA-directed RNA polymerase specialized sigma24 family protein